ncbi:MAG: vitamin B12 dependent-methionine synthase activation domain-containing protein [Bacteroidota bacterium]
MDSPFAQREGPDRVFLVDIPPSALAAVREETERTLGYSDGAAPEPFRSMIDEVVSLLPSKCRISAGYRLVEMNGAPGRKDGVYADGIFFRTQHIVTRLLRKAEEAALFALTIGPDMENWRKQLQGEGDLALGYIVDTAASVAVESAADLLHDHVGLSMSRRGMKITNRYSPGYCNWAVEEQHHLFSLLPPGFCDITLTDSAMMIPMKSISGLIGVGHDVKRVEYTCDTCGVKDCTHRVSRARRTRTTSTSSIESPTKSTEHD